MTYKRKAEQPTLVERFNHFLTLTEALGEYAIDYNEFFDWLEPLLADWVVTHFDERKKQFGEDMPKRAPKVDLKQDTSTRLYEWYQKQAALAQLKADEGALRQNLAMALFNKEKIEGSETIDIGNGWKLKVEKEQNVTATNASDQTVALLQQIGALDPQLAQNLVKWTPEISKTAYRDLIALAEKNPTLKPFMLAAITVKPGMPQLTMIEPKQEIVVETAVPLPGVIPGAMPNERCSYPNCTLQAWHQGDHAIANPQQGILLTDGSDIKW